MLTYNQLLRIAQSKALSVEEIKELVENREDIDDGRKNYLVQVARGIY